MSEILLTVEENTEEIPLEIEETGGGGVDPAELAKKADKVIAATEGNFAGLDEHGNLTDSGKKASDFATAEDLNAKYTKPEDGIPASDLAPGVIPSVPVQDVQVNGTSVVSQGVAEIPIAGSGLGVIKNGVAKTTGISIDENGLISVNPAAIGNARAGTDNYVITTTSAYYAAFFGLAKAAGADMKNVSGSQPGTYPEAQKSAISDMLNAPETISGTTPSITAKPGVRYICGEVSTLSITAPASGCIDVIFESGSTPTVLTVSSAKSGVTAIKWANGFDPTSLDANTTYEINILDGEFGVVGSWM